MRNTVLENISKKLFIDDKLIVLLGDLGVFQMKDAMKNFPSRVINFGIMEQTMIGFASGLSKGGFYPITYSITPFLVDRAFEQIKIDLIYNNNKTLILSAGASYDYSNLGPTHHCPHDVSNLLAINHPFIVHPFTKIESIKIINYLIKNKIQAYFRISSSECDLTSFKFEKVSKLNLDIKSSKENLFEKYESISQKENILSILFGPDSKYLNNFENIINKSKTIITISIINQKSIKELSNEINKYKEVYLFIPYDPSALILRLLKYINKDKRITKNIIALYPKSLFFDNSHKKENIFKEFTEESHII